MSNHDLLSKTTLEHKIRSCAFDNDGQHIAAGFTDGSFMVLRSRLGSMLFIVFVTEDQYMITQTHHNKITVFFPLQFEFFCGLLII